MRNPWVVAGWATLLGVLPVGVAFGQAPAPAYETPQYDAQPPEPLDKNYGLPTFGMPDAQLPQQKTNAPAAAAGAPTVPDFFNQAPSSELPAPDVAAAPGQGSQTPSDQEATPSDQGETPLYTTQTGAGAMTSTDETTSSDDGGLSSTERSILLNGPAATFTDGTTATDDAATR